MEYQALYRKWRPQRFEEVVGQRHITQTLQNALRSGNIAHAYLFCGPRGSGKTTTARLLAKALNCEKGPTPEPCNECDMCRAISEGRAMDVIEMDAASSTSVEDVRELRETVKLAPAQARYKVYIIDEVHRLSRSAFDALLKTLEEPPQNVIFVLATTEPNRVPSTIASRCQRFDFRRGSEREIKEYLRRVCEGEGIEIEEDALSLLASRAEGSWRDALSLLEQVWAYSTTKITTDKIAEVLGIVEEEVISRFIRAVAQGDVSQGIRIIGEIIDSGKDPREFLRGLSNRFRNLLLLKMGGMKLLEVEGEKKRKLAEEATYFSPETLLQMIEAVFSHEGFLRLSPSPRLPLEMLFARLLQIAGNLKEAEILVEEEAERVVEEERKVEAPAEIETQAKVELEKELGKEAVKPVEEAQAPPSQEMDLEAVLGKWNEVLKKLFLREGASNLWAVFKRGVKPVAVDDIYLTLGFPKSLEFAKKTFDKDERKHKILLSVLKTVFPKASWRLKTVLIEEEAEEEEKIEEGKIEEGKIEEAKEEEEVKEESKEEMAREQGEESEEIRRFRSIFPEAELLD